MDNCVPLVGADGCLPTMSQALCAVYCGSECAVMQLHRRSHKVIALCLLLPVVGKQQVHTCSQWMCTYNSACSCHFTVALQLRPWVNKCLSPCCIVQQKSLASGLTVCLSWLDDDDDPLPVLSGPVYGHPASGGQGFTLKLSTPPLVLRLYAIAMLQWAVSRSQHVVLLTPEHLYVVTLYVRQPQSE